MATSKSRQFFDCSHCHKSFPREPKRKRIYCGRICYASAKIEAIRDRFFTTVSEPTATGCTLWTGYIGPSGYGQTSYRGRAEKSHRVAWMLAHGPIPKGLSCCHTCDVRNCVNVSHLFLGTHADNNADMRHKGRARNNRKLTIETVRQIRARYAAGGVFMQTLADEHGVSYGAINAILHRRTWNYD